MQCYLRQFRLKGLRMTHVNRKPDKYGIGYQTLHIDQRAENCSLALQTSNCFVIRELLVAVTFVVLRNDLRHNASDGKMRGS